MKTLKFTISLAFFLLFCFSSFSQGVVNERISEFDQNKRLAEQYLSEGNYQKAAALYEELYNEDPSPQIYAGYIESLVSMEEYRQAEKLAEQQKQNNPGRKRYDVDLGWVYMQSGNERKAERYFSKLIDDLPPNPMLITDLANGFLLRRFNDYAVQTFLKGRELLQEEFSFNIQLARIYSRMGDYEKMMTEYIELIAFDPSQLDRVQGYLQDELANDPEYEKNNTLRRVLLQKVRQNPNEGLYSEMLLWLSIQQKDFDMALRQAMALDRRMQQMGQLVMDVARLSLSNNLFDVALKGYQYVLDKGDLNPLYLDAKMGKLNAMYTKATSGFEIDYELLSQVEQDYQNIIDQQGVRPQTVSILRNLANLKAFYLDNTKGALEVLQPVIDLPNVSARIKAECRIEMADIKLLNGDLWDAHLLYAQVDKMFRDDPLAHEARFKNARLSFYMGEFKWAKAQLDVLKAATSRLIANDAIDLSLLIQDNLNEDGESKPLRMFARSQMHIFMHNYDLAIQVLDSVVNDYPGDKITDNVLMQKAKIFSRTGKYEQASNLFQTITRQYPDGLFAAEALFLRAKMYDEVYNDEEVAMELYQQIIMDFPGSLHTLHARNRFRELRGDLIN